MAIVSKVSLPPIYGSEAQELERLVYIGSSRTTTGNITFQSTTSGVEYSTLTSYGGVYANTGQSGMFNILYERVLKDYILTDTWVNSITSTVGEYKVEVGSTAPVASLNKVWIDTN